VTATVAGALALTAACGGGGNTTTPENKSKGGYNAAVDSVVNPSTAKGGTLRMGFSSDIDSWDPARTYYAWGWNMNRFYTRKLVDYDAKVGAEGTKLVPDLASEMPQISADGMTYTFKLKDGIKFEDGTPITSKDIKYGIERIFAQDVLSGGPTYLIDFLDQGQKYPGPYKDTDPNKLGLKSVQTPDDKTIVFTLKEPFGDFPYLLAMPGAGPVPQAKDTGDKYANHPIASGPYMFESYQPGKSAILVRNPNWDPATDSFRKALPDKIELTLGLDPNEIDNRLLAGTLDIDPGQTGVQQAAQTKILNDNNLKQNADAFNNGFIRYFAISTVVKPFDNIHCRKAVQYAADKTALQTARGGPIAGGDIATNMLPPNIAGHDPNLDPFGTKQGKPQVDKAKEELAACGKPNGFDTVIAVRNRGKEPKTAEALQASLKQVGINAKIETHDASQYFRSVIGSPDNVHKKGYGIMTAGWGADWQTGYGYLQVLIDGRNILPSGNNNYEELNDPEINSLIDQARKESDPTKAADIWKQINAKVMDTASLMPFVYDKALNYRNPRLTNAYVHDAFGMLDFQALGLSDGK
jgi:peptide/nickel transport system substrate-binding protein